MATRSSSLLRRRKQRRRTSWSADGGTTRGLRNRMHWQCGGGPRPLFARATRPLAESGPSRTQRDFLGPRRVGFERELSCDLGCAQVKGARASAELASRAPQWLTTRTARRTRMTHSKPKVLCKRSSPRQKARCTSHRQGWSLHFSESRFWSYLCRCNSLPEVVARTAAPGPRPCSIPEQNARSDRREHSRHIRECEGTPLPCQR